MMNKLTTLLIVLLFAGVGYMGYRSNQPVPANSESRLQDNSYSNSGTQGIKTGQEAIGSGGSGVDSNQSGNQVNADSELSGLHEQQQQIDSAVNEILSLDREVFPAEAGNDGDIESSLVVMKAGVAALLSRIGQLTRELTTEAALSGQIPALKARNAELSSELSSLKQHQAEQLTLMQAGFDEKVAQHNASRENLKVTAEESKKQIELANEILQQKELILLTEQQNLKQLRRDIVALKQGMSVELSSKNQTLLDEQKKLQQLRQDIEALNQNMNLELGNKDQTLQDEQKKLQQLSQDIEVLKQSMNLELSQKDGVINQLRDSTTTIQLGSDVVFALGSTNLSDSGRAVLSRVTELIENYPEYLISLEGHTDNISIGAERQEIYPSNWELSAARGSAAARFLVVQGIDPHRLRVVGYGSNRAITDNDSEQGRAQNRRLEIRFSPKPRIRLAQ